MLLIKAWIYKCGQNYQRSVCFVALLLNDAVVESWVTKSSLREFCKNLWQSITLNQKFHNGEIQHCRLSRLLQSLTMTVGFFDLGLQVSKVCIHNNKRFMNNQPSNANTTICIISVLVCWLVHNWLRISR